MNKVIFSTILLAASSALAFSPATNQVWSANDASNTNCVVELTADGNIKAAKTVSAANIAISGGVALGNATGTTLSITGNATIGDATNDATVVSGSLKVNSNITATNAVTNLTATVDAIAVKKTATLPVTTTSTQIVDSVWVPFTGSDGTNYYIKAYLKTGP